MGRHLRLRPAQAAVGRPLLGHRRVDLGRKRRFAEGADDFERHLRRRDAEHKALRQQQFHFERNQAMAGWGHGGRSGIGGLGDWGIGRARWVAAGQANSNTLIFTACRSGASGVSVPTNSRRFSQAWGPSGAMILTTERA